MAQLDQHLANIRQVWLDEPLPGRPSLRHLWTLLLAEIQNGVNQITNTSQNWRTGEADITFDPSVEEVLVNAPGISKPLVVYTKDEANPHHNERVVDIVGRQNLVIGYDGTRDGSGRQTYLYPFDGQSWHVAQKIAIYQKGDAGSGGQSGVWYASARPVVPADGHSATYKLIYADGSWTDNAALSSQPVLTEYGSLFEVRAAQLALSQAAWWPNKEDEPLNAAKRKEKAMILAAAEARYAPMFDRHVASLLGRRVSFKASNW